MAISKRLTTLTRLGFAARGLLYIVIAFLVIGTGRTEDPSGALEYLGRGAGKWLLVLMAAGLAAYGLWRLADAALGIENHKPGNKGLRERVGAGASGLIHLFLAWQAVRLIQGAAGADAASSESGSAQEGAQTALALPGGTLLLTLAGLVLIGVGIFQFVKAVRSDFCDDLEPSVAHQPSVKWLGRAGYSARGLVFLISGGFLTGAGLKGRASEAGGMEEALTWLSSPWDTIVAIGLLMFGLFSLVEARFRVIHEVPVDGVARRARSKLPI